MLNYNELAPCEECTMGQITIYLDEKNLQKVKRAAKRDKTSVSQWAKKRLTNAIEKTWPDDYFELFGSLADVDLTRADQPVWKNNLQREPMIYCLDTNICIYAKRQIPEYRKTASITYSELHKNPIHC